MSTFLGEDVLNDFLRGNQKIISNPHGHINNQSVEEDEDDIKLLQELEVKISDKGDTNATAMKKVARINQEIKAHLLQEEHNNNMKELNDLHIQENQKFWTTILNRPTK